MKYFVRELMINWLLSNSIYQSVIVDSKYKRQQQTHFPFSKVYFLDRTLFDLLASCSLLSHSDYIYLVKLLLQQLQLVWLSLPKKCPYSELFCSTFSRIRTEYGEILRISPCSAQMRENVEQNNSEYRHFLPSVFEKRFMVLQYFIIDNNTRKSIFWWGMFRSNSINITFTWYFSQFFF